jgi:CheY-like chemotaxis protein
MEKQPVTMVDIPRSVYVAYSGAAAFELIYEHAEIELVLTDHAMPEMTGSSLPA